MNVRIAIAVLLVALGLPGEASAALKVWDGGGADSNWMTKENWVGDVAPVPNEDSLEFPEGAARKTNTNNFPSGSLFLGIHFSGATGGYALSGNLLVLSGAITSSNTAGANTINFAISTSADAALTAVHSAGTLAVAQVSLMTDLALSGAGNIIVNGLVNSTGGLTKTGSGVATLTADNTYTGTTTLLDGTLIINGAQSGTPITMMSGTVGGAGTLGALAAYSGTVSPGASPGLLKAGSTTMTAGTTFRVELNGTGTAQFDQLTVTGTVDLGGGAMLNPTLGYVPANNAQFTIINNDGTDPVVGTFAGLPEGTALTIGGRSFTITYLGGDGNDIVLTAVPISYISGTVTNASTGAPVANVSIWIYKSTGGFAASTVTNSQGLYLSPSLSSGSYFVKALPPVSLGLLGRLYDNLPCPDVNCSVTGGTAVAVTAPSGTPNINFALPTGATITGIVTNAETSAPVADVAVTIYSNTGAFVTGLSTNAQGVYSIIGMPTGSYFMKAVPPVSSGLLPQLYNNLPCPGGNCEETSGTPVAATAPNTTTVNFALPAGATITGTVTNAMTGAPAAGTLISIYTSSGAMRTAAFTNEQGVYTTTTGLPSGSYFVKATPQPLSGLLGQLYNNLPCYDANCNVTSGTAVAVTAPNATTINFALPVGATITGTVTNATTSTPVANVSVRVYSSTGSIATTASTNAQGVYTTSMGLPTGSYFLEASPPSSSGLLGQLYKNLLCHNGNCEVTSGTPVAVTAPNATTIDFALPVGATITGTVTNATTAAPVASLVVRFYSSTGQSIGTATTNAQGYYFSPALVPGTYFVVADPASSFGLVAQLYNNIPCPGGSCSILSGTAVAAASQTPNINFALMQPLPAPNDTFAAATVINSLPYQSIVNTTAATTSAEDPVVACGNNSAQKSVWYLYTPAVDGPVAVNTIGSNYDTILAIYTGSPGSFVSAGCNDDANGAQSALTIQATAGQRLAILVTAYSGPGGILVLNVAGVPAAFNKVSPKNTATTVPTNVTLSWETSTDAQGYEYCLDTSHNSFCNTNWIPVGNATSVGLTGLLPSTKYSWHVRALNVGATTYAEGSTTAFWSFTTIHSPLILLNDDGLGDVFAHHPATGAMQLNITQADGSFETTVGSWSPGWNVAPAIFDADALTDFFLFNATTGQWQKMRTTPFGFQVDATGAWWPGWERYVMDLNGDGLSDLFLYDPATGVWFQAFSTPTGFTYQQGAWNPGWEIYPMRLNDDAFGDMFLMDRTTGRWFWVLGAANGVFTYPASEYWLPDWQLYPGDFNGDGLSDLFLFHPDAGEYYVAFSTGAGFSYFAGYGWVAGWTPYVGDFDADGKDDLFLHGAATGVWFQMIGDGNGNFTSVGGQQQWVLGWNLYLTDFNADGRADILLYDPATGAWFQARNLVNGTFSYTSGAWAPGLTVITKAPNR